MSYLNGFCLALLVMLAVLVRVSPDGSQATWNRSPAQDAYLVLGERA